MPAEGTRLRLPQYHTIEHAISLLRSSTNILLLTGAGISTSAGIPDFRSEGGAFQQIKETFGMDPEEFLHIDTFRTDPEMFYQGFCKIVPGAKVNFTPTHAFIRLLQDRGKLLRNYTQNIDQLEAKAGVEADKLVHCHGTMTPGQCISCGYVVKSANRFLTVVRNVPENGAPRCPKCHEAHNERLKELRAKAAKAGKKRKKRDWDEDSDEEDHVEHEDDIGILRPSIVFYGEEPADDYRPRFEEDRKRVDLLIIIGTSLKVKPVAEILQKIPPTVPQIYISRQKCKFTGVTPDIELLGFADIVVGELARRADWELKHDDLPETPKAVKVDTMEGTDNVHFVGPLKLPPNQAKKLPKVPNGVKD